MASPAHPEQEVDNWSFTFRVFNKMRISMVKNSYKQLSIVYLNISDVLMLLQKYINAYWIAFSFKYRY